MGKVLLVEDDNNLREIFEMRLQAEGYQTIGANDGEEALVVATKEKPDLIIADIMMPKLSGFEMVENLKAIPGMNDVKVIMMTALGQAEDRARGEKLGVVKYLVKSQVTLEDFVRVVREVLPPSGDANSTDGADDQKSQNVTTTNNQESEQVMQDDTTNQDQTTPMGTPEPSTDIPAGGSMPGSNPVSGGDTPSAAADDQMSTAQEQSAVDEQVNSFAAGAPAADNSAAASGPTSMPSSDPSPLDGGNMPAQDIPPSPTPTSPPDDGSPTPPTEQPEDEGGPSGPTPAPGV